MLIKLSQLKKLKQMKRELQKKETLVRKSQGLLTKTPHKQLVYAYNRHKLIALTDATHEKRLMLRTLQDFSVGKQPLKMSWKDTYKELLGKVKSGLITV